MEKEAQLEALKSAESILEQGKTEIALKMLVNVTKGAYRRHFKELFCAPS